MMISLNAPAPKSCNARAAGLVAADLRSWSGPGSGAAAAGVAMTAPVSRHVGRKGRTSGLHAAAFARARGARLAAGPDAARGLSLVELMVALLLGLLLTAGMIQLFDSTKVTFQTNDAVARVQENGRFAMETLKRQLRPSNSRGFCAGEIRILNHLRTDCGFGGPDFFATERSVVGWEFTGTGRGDEITLSELAAAPAGSWSSVTSTGTTSLPAALASRAIAGSDVLVLRLPTVIPDLTAKPGVNNTSQAQIELNRAHDLIDDAIVLVTDCGTGADLFQNTTSAGSDTFSASGGSCFAPGPGNIAVEWSTKYEDTMQTVTVSLLAYYIGVDQDTGEPGLYQLDLSGGTAGARPQELVRGVENMQVLFGFSRAAPAGDGESVRPGDWLRGDQVPVTTNNDGWAQVIAIQLGLSVRSPETADFDATDVVFDLAGTNVTVAGDGRIRQSFTTTVALRNRMLVTPQ